MIDRIKLLLNRTSVFQGLLAGVFIFVAKVIVYLTQHWEYRFLPAFTVLSFLIILSAMIMGGLGDRKQLEGSHYQYKQALMSCLRAVFFAVLIGSFADFVLYSLVDVTLVEQTKSILIEQLQDGLGQMKFMSNDDFDKLVKEIRAAEMGTLWSYLSGLPGLVLANMFFGLFVARFLRVKKEADWLSDDSNHMG
ncbi:MAG: DUF4199 domain-containing protein [Bacteroidetes bacterium]|jgi:hypothetical protein|nr:DUF4199 domain-containing protein [Bacteroidota bacterium]